MVGRLQMPRKKKTIVHVNQHVIKSNNKTIRENPDNWLNLIQPPLTIKSGKMNTYGDRADIIVNGEVVATIVHSPDKPLSCGARVWIETYEDVVVSRRNGSEE